MNSSDCFPLVFTFPNVLHFTHGEHNHIIHFKKHVWHMQMNGTYSGTSMALPTVRAENFWARPAHSRQRKTSSGQTRILSQRGNKLSKLRTVQNSICVAWILPKHEKQSLEEVESVQKSTIVLAQKYKRWRGGCWFISLRLLGFVCQAVCVDTLLISGSAINPPCPWPFPLPWCLFSFSPSL